MGDAVMKLAMALDPEVAVALAGQKVWIPPHKSVTEKGKTVDVEGHWRTISSLGDLNPDERKAFLSQKRGDRRPDLYAKESDADTRKRVMAERAKDPTRSSGVKTVRDDPPGKRMRDYAESHEDWAFSRGGLHKRSQRALGRDVHVDPPGVAGRKKWEVAYTSVLSNREKSQSFDSFESAMAFAEKKGKSIRTEPTGLDKLNRKLGIAPSPMKQAKNRREAA